AFSASNGHNRTRDDLLIMKQPTRRYIILLFACAAAGVAVWAALRFTNARLRQSIDIDPVTPTTSEEELWARGVEKVKADRGAEAGKVALEIPPELKHYEERRWFLATQDAEVHKQNVQSCQDFIDLAAMIKRGELRTVPLATENYILFGVGQK